MDVYKIESGKAKPILTSPLKLEKDLQKLIERNLETIFSIKFLSSEYSTGEKHGGRIDTLGLDENNAPVIIEYKLKESKNVMNQALFYLDWLIDHKGDFEILTMKKLGKKVDVDWLSPRVICLSDSFSKYDSYAVSQIGGPIELIQYRYFADNILILERIDSGKSTETTAKTTVGEERVWMPKDHLKHGSDMTRALFEEIHDYILNLGEDVEEKYVKNYIAYRTIRNFCCLEIHKKKLLLYLKLLPGQLPDPLEIGRDVRNIGHFGTGGFEVTVSLPEHIDEAKRFIKASYEGIGSE